MWVGSGAVAPSLTSWAKITSSPASIPAFARSSRKRLSSRSSGAVQISIIEKRPLSRPMCESAMFRPCSSSAPVTEDTIPGRSGPRADTTTSRMARAYGKHSPGPADRVRVTGRGVFDFLTHLVNGSATSYFVIAGLVAADSLFPLIPGETAMITGGVLAANGDLSIPLVIVAGWIGGMVGDNANYWLGRSLGSAVRRRFFTSDKSLRNLAWAETQLELRGTPIILAARFIPGGRTATMFSAGSLEMPWRRFLSADAIAAGVWAVYATGLGYLGGETFRHSVWKPLLVALVFAAIVTVAGEIYRRKRLPDDGKKVRRRFRRFKREAQRAT